MWAPNSQLDRHGLRKVSGWLGGGAPLGTGHGGAAATLEVEAGRARARGWSSREPLLAGCVVVGWLGLWARGDEVGADGERLIG